MQLLLDKLANNKEENERVFHKETYVLRNDLYFRFYEHRGNRWFVDISYKPKQTPSGDTYSIRKIGENKILILLIDAMGKGLTASITSILSSAFINDYVDRAGESFDLLECIQTYHKYISKLIFEEEVVSCSFVLFDFDRQEALSALFGMPPILLCDEEEKVTKLRSNNAPLTRFTDHIDLQKTPIEHIYKILLYTDGLNETIIDDRYMYRYYLDQDFLKAPNYKHFFQEVLRRTNHFDDDMTFIFLERERCNHCQIKLISIPTRHAELDNAMKEVELFLTKHGMDTKNRAYMMQAFSELLFNAYEHGNLGIDHQTKRRLLEEAKFDAFIEEKERKYGEKKIKILLHVKDEPHLKTFKIDMQDEGAGFDTALMRNRIVKKEQFNGRGLLMVSRLADAYYYNTKGNRVILKKFKYKELKNG
ncbi:MAG: hypothetical protein B6D59_02690 [Campylobacteraceae bacterium 4484_4]|nr:MAG: hypothetical protein B6D59_02690 [Campylobacteraceae bacterium 4484_4]